MFRCSPHDKWIAELMIWIFAQLPQSAALLFHLDQLCDLSLFQVTVWYLEWTPHDPWQINRKYIWSSCWQGCCLACPCPPSPCGCVLHSPPRTSTTTSPYWPWVSTAHAETRHFPPPLYSKVVVYNLNSSTRTDKDTLKTWTGDCLSVSWASSPQSV